MMSNKLAVILQYDTSGRKAGSDAKAALLTCRSKIIVQGVQRFRSMSFVAMGIENREMVEETRECSRCMTPLSFSLASFSVHLTGVPRQRVGM